MSRIAIVMSILGASLLVGASAALAAPSAPAWSVTATGSSPASTAAVEQGDGLQGGYDLGNVNSWPNLDYVTETVTNTGSAASSGAITVTPTLSSGISVADILNSWTTAATAQLTNTSTTVNNVTATTAGYPYQVGNVVTGTGITASPPTTITSVTPAAGSPANGPVTYTLVLSAPATSTVASETLTVLPGEGTTASGSPTISNVTGGPYAVGNTVSGTGVGSGAIITAVSGTSPNITLTVSVNSTANGTVALTEAATRATPTVGAGTSGATGTCTNAAAPVCTISSTVGAGQTFTISIPVQVTATAGSGTGYLQGGSTPDHIDTSTVISGGGAAASSTTVIPIAIAGIPNLTTVDTPDGPFRQGDSADDYTITVTNNGVGPTDTNPGSMSTYPYSAGGATPVDPNDVISPPSNPIVVTETIPTGETAVAMYGPGWTCSIPATTTGIGGALYTEPANSCYRSDGPWDPGALLPQITLVTSILTNATASQSLSTKVSGGDTEGGSASVSTPTTVQQLPDLVVESYHTSNFNQGDPNDFYFIASRNIVGPNSTSGGPSVGPVTIVDTPPTGITITGMSGAGWSCTLTPATLVSPPTIPFPDVLEPADSCTRSDSLPVNTNYPTITVTVAVANYAGVTGQIGNTATIYGGGMTAASVGDPSYAPETTVNNVQQTETDQTTVNPEPDLTVTGLQEVNGTTSPSVVFTQGDGAGAGDGFFITPYNYGFAPTSGTITVVDTIPNDFSLVSTSTPGTGSGWTCTTGSSNHLVTCTTSAVAAAGSALPPITIPVTVSQTAGLSPTNNVVISGGSEINSGNDYSNEIVIVNQLPDLTMEVTDSGNITANSTGSFYLDATNLNLGPTIPGDPVTVTDSVSPTGGTVTLNSLSGTGWTCTNTATSGSCTTTNVLSPDATYPTITASVTTTGASAPISDTATVSGGGEINTSNDTATDTISAFPGLVRALAVGGSSVGGSSSAASGSASGGSPSSAVSLAQKALVTKRLARRGSRYTVSGTVARSGACSGTVSVVLEHGTRVVARRSARVTSRCTYSVKGKLSGRARSESLVIRALLAK